MAFIGMMDRGSLDEQQRKHCLEFLAGFLDDLEVRDVQSNPKLFSGPHAGFTFPRLAVRDLAAMTTASILELKVRPEPEWTDQQWEKLRTKVKQALKR